MKKILSSLLFFICFFISTAQPPSVRSPASVTAEDYNLWVLRSFRVPCYQDTTAANAASPVIDSLGRDIFTYDIMAKWIRCANSNGTHFWLQLLPSGGSGGTKGWAIGGNPSPILVDGNNNASIGTSDAAIGMLFKTNGTTRFTIPPNGIKDNSSASVKYLGVDTTGGGFRPLAFASAPSSVNIYNSDGTLTGDRTVSTGTHLLNFNYGIHSGMQFDPVNHNFQIETGTNSDMGVNIDGTDQDNVKTNLTGDNIKFTLQDSLNIINLPTAGSTTGYDVALYNTTSGQLKHIAPSSIVSGSAWALTGNSGTTTSNFIGTTDSVPFAIKAFNIQSGGISVANSSTNFGYYSMQSNTGIENTAFGRSAMYTNSTGTYNTGIGAYSLYSNTSGQQNTATGDHSLTFNTTGVSNVANGVTALSLNTTGSYNTAIGAGSQTHSSTAHNNTTLGYHTMHYDTSGVGNVAIGYYAGEGINSGSYNTLVGDSISGIVTGSNNTIVGARITGLSSSLANNIIIGDGAGNIRMQFNSSGNPKLSNVPTGVGAKALRIDGSGNVTSADTTVGGAVSAPNTEVVLGTGTGVTSNNRFTYNPSAVSGAGFFHLAGDGEVIVGANNFDISASSETIIRTDHANNLLILGDADATNNGDALTLNPHSHKSYFDNTSHDTKLGINTSTPTVALESHGDLLLQGAGGNTNFTMTDATQVILSSTDDGQAVELNGTSHYVELLSGANSLNVTSADGVVINTLIGTSSRAVLADASGVLSAPISDARKKKNMIPIANYIDIIGMLRNPNIHGIFYNWIDSARGKAQEIGFTAQMFEGISGLTGTMTKSGDKYLNYDRIPALLWEQNRQQQVMIDDQERRIKNLEAKVTKLCKRRKCK